jgi:drug/metabolite transporter (DMT)-like permease
MAVAGTAIVEVNGMVQGSLIEGFLIVQASNLCFAFGQVFYRKVMRDLPQAKDTQIFAIPYLGAALITFVTSAAFGGFQNLALTGSQVLTLVYLGAFASGICFFLWNIGARKVDIGALAIFNNLKVPLAVTVSLVFFGEKANLANLLLGGLIVVAALAINEYSLRHRAAAVQAATN